MRSDNSEKQVSLYPDGFIAIRSGLFEHLRDGRMHPTMFVIYATILEQCDWSTGLWLGSALRLFDSFGQRMELRTIRDNLARLFKSGYLKSFRVTGRRGNYYVAINKYRPTVGVLRTKQLNADKSTSCDALVYESRSDDVLTVQGERTDGAVTVQWRCSDGAPYQDKQDVLDSKDAQDDQEVKSKIAPAPRSPIQSEPNGQEEPLALELSEIADREGHSILFTDIYKKALASLLRQYSPEQITKAWVEYLDKHLDGSEFSISHAARLFTETAEQLIHVIGKRATDSIPESLSDGITESSVIEEADDISELDAIPELDLSMVPEANYV